MGKRLSLVLALCLSASMMNAATDGTQVENNQQGYEAEAMQGNVVDSVAVQDNEEYDGRWYVGVHVGANYAMSENTRFGSFGDMLKPSVAVSAGKYFTPLWGGRVQLGYMRQTSRVNKIYLSHDKAVYGDGNYNFSVFAGYVDGLLNLNKLFSRDKKKTRFNIAALAGIGLNCSFNFDEDKIDGWKSAIENAKKSDPKGGHYFYYIDTSSHCCFAMRAGLLGSYTLNNNLDLNLEATLNAATDKLNGVKNSMFADGYVNVMVGLAYHFND